MLLTNPQTIDMQVLGSLRDGRKISRVELARQLSIAPSTVGTHVDRLVSTGLLLERKGKTNSAGRPPTIVELNSEAGQFIGIDLDSREIHGVSVDFAQRLLRDRTETITARETASEVIERICSVIEDVRDDSRELLGVAIAVPGTVEIETGRVIHYRHIRGWRNISLASEIASRIGRPVSIENNVRTMAFAERSFGQAKQVNDFISLCIRSGIGSGVFLDGKIYRGTTGSAGEIGVWPCESPGSLRNARKAATTLEEVASLIAILEQCAQLVREGRSQHLKLVRNRVTMEGLIQAIESKDRAAQNVLQTAANTIGKAVAQISLLVDPERIVVNGPLAVLTESFVEPLRQAVHDYLPTNHSNIPEVIASQLGPLAGALGAAALATQQWQPAK